ncbi:F-box protein At3g07870-like [Chenopodium quinoa]|uniref:F-box domain-containing protein n=1 Tax=Chenopodium quinoa TaxID=63459 RepID=A0A803KTG4_CHEQI|nr:F-box protein At3g07870-like [Chenopodium quinoa]
MKKVELNQSFFEVVPTSIILEILSRLPIKACLSCKLVCKDWYRIIVSFEYATLRSSLRFYVTILLHGTFSKGENDFLLLDLDDSSKIGHMGDLNVSVDAMIKFQPELIINPPHKVRVINECNGLICLKPKAHRPYIICNLLTGQQVIVEQFPRPPCTVVVYGLGCCLVSHQFKLVRLLKTEQSCVVEIQTLGTNEWRIIGGDNAPQFHLSESWAFFNESLHRYSYVDNCIWSFHFGNEQFSQVSLPDDMNAQRFGEVGVFDSCLYFTSASQDHRECEIWVMKVYGDKGSWVKQFVFLKEFYSHYMPILQLGDGKILMSYCNVGIGHGLRVCDVESGRYRRVRVLEISDFELLLCNAKFSKL